MFPAGGGTAQDSKRHNICSGKADVFCIYVEVQIVVQCNEYNFSIYEILSLAKIAGRRRRVFYTAKLAGE